jgi:hypothetical protein
LGRKDSNPGVAIAKTGIIEEVAAARCKEMSAFSIALRLTCGRYQANDIVRDASNFEEMVCLHQHLLGALQGFFEHFDLHDFDRLNKEISGRG